MGGIQRAVQEGLEHALIALRWVSSALAADNDVEVQLDNVDGSESPETDPAELWTIAGVQSRPKNGNETDGYAHALTVQLGDTTLVIGSHDPRHVEVAELGEVVLHALGKDGSLRALVRLKPDGSIDVSGTKVIIGNPDGTLAPIGLGDAITNHFDSIKTVFDAHIHVTTATVGLAPVGTIAPTLTAFTTTPTTLGSSKHEVET